MNVFSRLFGGQPVATQEAVQAPDIKAMIDQRNRKIVRMYGQLLAQQGIFPRNPVTGTRIKLDPEIDAAERIDQLRREYVDECGGQWLLPEEYPIRQPQTSATYAGTGRSPGGNRTLGSVIISSLETRTPDETAADLGIVYSNTSVASKK